ncbi:T5orf172 domain-containing protein [Luteibacter sp. OK325]|uniref:GIY-YIG nuclease family protein n=1 Tax=Luteibacter sp. OK325 TaxID=2135670 RepID=UPI000D341FCB|nr:GIY-YIG nuclease family protein [Luteibacter sp. OK325]PTR30858.1 T5orf172 domain-containing protein [Luteibacter sp. OK325]
MEEDSPYPRFASRGKAYVYVLPCRDEDLLKVGFSRDPFTRFSTLHRRFFDFFDLERGLLLDAERVVHARRIERRLIETFREQRAMAPLVVPASAAGHTEWYRGVHADVAALLEDIASAEGLNLSRSLNPWLRAYLEARADLLYDWSTRILDTLDWAAHNSPDDPDAKRLRTALIDTLDMFVAAGLAVEPRLPQRVIDWYANGQHRHLFD